MGVLSNYGYQGGPMRFVDFVDSMKSISQRIRKEDVIFLLSYLGIELRYTKEVDIDNFLRQLESVCQRTNILTNMQSEVVFRRQDRNNFRPVNTPDGRMGSSQFGGGANQYQ